jgi:hypothetical protein
MKPGYEVAVQWTNGWEGRITRRRWRKWTAYVAAPPGLWISGLRYGRRRLFDAQIGHSFTSRRKAVAWLEQMGKILPR